MKKNKIILLLVLIFMILLLFYWFQVKREGPNISLVESYFNFTNERKDRALEKYLKEEGLSLEEKIKSEELSYKEEVKKYFSQENRLAAEEVLDCAILLAVYELPFSEHFFHHPMCPSEVQKITELYREIGNIKKSHWLSRKYAPLVHMFWKLNNIEIWENTSWGNEYPGWDFRKGEKAKELIQENKISEAISMVEDDHSLVWQISNNPPKVSDPSGIVKIYIAILEVIPEPSREHTFLLEKIIEDCVQKQQFDDALMWIKKMPDNRSKIEPLVVIASGLIHSKNKQLSSESKQMLKEIVIPYLSGGK